jgi:hypothetical protein
MHTAPLCLFHNFDLITHITLIRDLSLTGYSAIAHAMVLYLYKLLYLCTYIYIYPCTSIRTFTYMFISLYINRICFTFHIDIFVSIYIIAIFFYLFLIRSLYTSTTYHMYFRVTIIS